MTYPFTVSVNISAVPEGLLWLGEGGRGKLVF